MLVANPTYLDALLNLALTLEMELREVEHERRLRGPGRMAKRALDDRERRIRSDLASVDQNFERCAALKGG